LGLNIFAKVYLLYSQISLESTKLIKASKGITKDNFERDKNQNKKFYPHALQFFSSNSGRTEILRGGKLEFVDYPLLPFRVIVDDYDKNEFLEGFPVGQPKAKLDYIMHNATDFIIKQRNEYMFQKIFSKYPVIGAFTLHIALWKKISFHIVPS
jgi:hypothetical protein